jgi:hypothetical protein
MSKNDLHYVDAISQAIREIQQWAASLSRTGVSGEEKTLRAIRAKLLELKEMLQALRARPGASDGTPYADSLEDHWA